MHGKYELQVLDCEIDLLENEVCQFCVGCVCFNSCFLFLAYGALKFEHFVLIDVN